MRFCCTFLRGEELSCPKERPEAHRAACESVRAALLAVDDADSGAAFETRLAQRLDGRDRRAAGGHDVLDEAHPGAFRIGALEPVSGAVVLRLLADDQEGQARDERGGGDEGDRAELGAREQAGLRFGLERNARDPLAERLEQLRTGLEAVLVEVVARAAARPEDEVALQVGMLAERPLELVVGQRAAARTARARGSRRSASAEPSVSETIDPSSK